MTETDQLLHWQLHPEAFVEDVLGITERNGFRMSNQQRSGCEAVGGFVRAKFAVLDGRATDEIGRAHV